MAEKPDFESHWSGWIETQIFVPFGEPSTDKILVALQNEARKFGAIGVWFDRPDVENSRLVFGLQGPADAVLAFVRGKGAAND